MTDEKTVPVCDTIHRQNRTCLLLIDQTLQTMVSQLMRYKLPKTGEAVHFMVNILRTIPPCRPIWKPLYKYKEQKRFVSAVVSEMN